MLPDPGPFSRHPVLLVAILTQRFVAAREVPSIGLPWADKGIVPKLVERLVWLWIIRVCDGENRTSVCVRSCHLTDM